MKYVIVVVVVLGIVLFGALNYHVIRVDGGVKFLKKSDMTLEDTYVDATGSNKYKLFLNPALIKAGIKKVLADEGITINKK
ncbi:hypothetical protein QUF76_06915 [Desulfobacterales bacterium HSG16]|nr:hypothetical protein [Desulfobacterales bacterium HSG16]